MATFKDQNLSILHLDTADCHVNVLCERKRLDALGVKQSLEEKSEVRSRMTEVWRPKAKRLKQKARYV